MKTMRYLTGTIGLTIALGVVGFSGLASAQTSGVTCVAGPGGTPTQYPPAASGVTVGGSTAPAGGSVEIAGCATPNSTVTFTVGTRVLGTAQTNNSGLFRAAVALPCDLPTGSQTLRITGAGINTSTTINVSGQAAACVSGTTTTALPRTGSSSTAPLVAAGIGLVLIGVATATAARRRSAANAADQ